MEKVLFEKLKNNKGISVITLVITITVISLLAGTIMFNTFKINETKEIDELNADLTIISKKVDLYYLKYGKLPVLSIYSEEINIPAKDINPNDYGNYYILDINALENLSNVDENRTYIINENTHTVYSIEGVEYKGKKIYKLDEEYSIVDENISFNYSLQAEGEKVVIYTDIECPVDGINSITFPDGTTKQYSGNTKIAEESYIISSKGVYTYTVTTNANESREYIVDADYTIISFDLNGGAGDTIPSVIAINGKKVPKIHQNSPTKVDYVFDGWYDTPSETGGTQYYSSNGTGIRDWDKTEETANLYARYKEMPTLIVAENNPTSTSSFLGNSTVKRNKIEKVEFKDSVQNANSTAWDVSTSGDRSILAWYTDSNSNGKYEVYIASIYDKVYANPDSSYLFCYIGYSINAEITGLEYLDTRWTTSMRAMFTNCRNITSLDVSHFDTSNVTTFQNLFQYCNKLESLDVSHFNTTNATNMSGMFNGCFVVANIDVSHFNTNNVTDMSKMFFGCNSIENIDVSRFSTINVTSVNGMFAGCKKLENIDLSSFDTRNVEDMGKFLSSCELLTNIDLSNFNTSNTTDMSGMFDKCTALASIDLCNFDTSKVTTMNAMFRDCTSLTEMDVSWIENNSLRDIGEMFHGCSNITSINIEVLNTSSIENFNYLFANMYKLTSVNLTNFDTSSATIISGLFFNCTGLTSIDVSLFDTRNVQEMHGVFYGCNNITSLDVSNWNTSNVTDMSYLFYNCNKLEELDVSNFNTGKVTDMSFMFGGTEKPANKLTSIDVSNWNTENVKDMCAMFYNCSYLRELDVSNWNTSKVTNMSTMFETCRGLSTLDLLKWDTSKVTNMSRMFKSCWGLTSLDLSSFNTSKVSNTSEMFSGCSDLTNIYVSERWNMAPVTNSSKMFTSCSQLPNYNSSYTNKTYAHYNEGGYLTYKSYTET